jgi:hypothetical protein
MTHFKNNKMDNQPLDAIDEPIEPKNYLAILKESLPILILMWVVSNAIFTYFTTDYTADLARILGIIGVLVSAFIFFVFDRKIGIWILIGILLVSLFGFVKFSPDYHTFSIFFITFSPLPTFMFFFTCYWNNNHFKSGKERLKQIPIIKKMLDFWYSLPE